LPRRPACGEPGEAKATEAAANCKWRMARRLQPQHPGALRCVARRSNL